MGISTYGILAGLALLLLGLQDIRDGVVLTSVVSEWARPVGLTMFGAAVLTRFIPKFVVLSFFNLLAHIVALIGGILLAIHFAAVFNSVNG